MRPPYARAETPKERQKKIRDKCVECKGSLAKASKCPAKECVLYAFRRLWEVKV